MSLALPGALALLGTVLLVVLFALLRTRRRRREVATYFVWRELRDSLSTRAQRLRALLDPLLLLQIATIAAVVLAMAQPLIASRRAGFATLAIVLDASASMSTRMDSGLTRYEAAARRADEILSTCPASSVSIVLLSQTPRVLVSRESNLAAARKAVAASAPGWDGDGSASDLIRGLEAVGGPSSFEQIVLLSDHSIDDLPFPTRLETFNEGKNVGLTAFSVRQNPDGAGVSAFVELHNGTTESRDLRMEITDEKSRTSVETYLEPGDTSSYVVPFPTSRGTQFTASVAAHDAFPYDDVRYASLDRENAFRVLWLGKTNRYLAAALDSSAATTRVEAGPADLTVVYDTTLDALPSGNLLLVHSNVRDVVTLSARATSGVAATANDDPLLAAVHPDDIYAESLPLVDVLLPYRSLLTAGGSPFILRILDPGRLILVLPSDLTATNLPITVDFPILIRNLVSSVMPQLPTAASHWTLVGSGVALGSAAAGSAILDPQGHSIALLPEQRAFFPEVPGQYSIRVGDTTKTVSVNIDPRESVSPEPEELGASTTSLPPLSAQSSERHMAIWPLVAAAFLVLLAAEFVVYRRRVLEERSLG